VRVVRHLTEFASEHSSLLKRRALSKSMPQNRTVTLSDGKPAIRKRLRLFFLIRSLDIGGAERQLTELVKRLDVTRLDVVVATFYDGGALRAEIESLPGVRIISLRKSGRWDVIPFLARLARVVREFRPEVLHGYMGISNELCSLMARLFGGRAIWGVRMSDWDASCYDWLSGWATRSSAWFSPLADLIIVNSYAGKRAHLARGYNPDRMVVIHNGIDTTRFRPDPPLGRKKRREWSISEQDFLIGLIGRLDPQKDHLTFLRAAALTLRQRANVRFVCVGDGHDEPYKKQVRTLASDLGLEDRLVWSPASNDVLAIYNAMDLVTLSSRNAEGFANVVGEAMSCAIPVVVTDVGDLALIVGEKDQVVPIQRPDLLAQAWCRVIDMTPEEHERLGSRERARILEEFDVARLAEKTIAEIETII
jgi:glycosyltransferase involved in cell wall biosynthesis